MQRIRFVSKLYFRIRRLKNEIAAPTARNDKTTPATVVAGAIIFTFKEFSEIGRLKGGKNGFEKQFFPLFYYSFKFAFNFASSS